jgi:FkbM family methyltransferase
MKRVIQGIANRLGYRLCRIDRASADPFIDMRRLCKDVGRPTIFDVGAHHGQTALRFREIFPESLILSFEPFPESFGTLRRNTASDPNIKTFDFGLSDKDGVFKFHSNPSSATNSLLSTDCQGSATWCEGLLETEKIVEARFRTLDSVIQELQLPKVNILKIDVQGAEYLVLEGAKSAFREGRIDIVYSEIITQPTYENQKRFDQALGAVYECGFDLYNIYNPSLTQDGRLRQVDVIFTRKA